MSLAREGGTVPPAGIGQFPDPSVHRTVASFSYYMAKVNEPILNSDNL